MLIKVIHCDDFAVDPVRHIKKSNISCTAIVQGRFVQTLENKGSVEENVRIEECNNTGEIVLYQTEWLIYRRETFR